MVDHVLVPVDGSDRSDDALEFARSEHPEATVTALHVIDRGRSRGALPIQATAPDTHETLRDGREETAQAVLEDVERRPGVRGDAVQADTMVRGVAHSIVGYAAEHDVDRVVLGSHGRTGARRVLRGSVAETVAREAPIPVTIVP